MQGYAITVYRDNIEPNLPSRGTDLSKVFRNRSQARSLAPVHRRKCRTEAGPVTALDLDDGKDPGIEADQVGLAIGGAIVADEDAISVLLQERRGRILTPPSLGAGAHPLLLPHCPARTRVRAGGP